MFFEEYMLTSKGYARLPQTPHADHESLHEDLIKAALVSAFRCTNRLGSVAMAPKASTGDEWAAMASQNQLSACKHTELESW